MKPRYFTHYWRNTTLNQYQISGNAGLEYVADNKFIERGVKSGDVVYPISIFDGLLYLIGRLEVERVCSLTEVEEYLGHKPSWQASDYLIAAEHTDKHFDLEVPAEVTRELRFVSGKETRPPKFISLSHLDQQTLRGVRELTIDSATKLDRLLMPK